MPPDCADEAFHIPVAAAQRTILESRSFAIQLLHIPLGLPAGHPGRVLFAFTTAGT